MTGMTEPTQDAVDRIAGQWNREMPQLDTRPMAVFGRIYRIAQLSGARQHRIYQRFGIGRNEFDVLASLRRAGEPFTLAPKQISASLMLTSGGLTGRLDKLERAGLVERLPDPEDRRALRVRLTDAGRQAVEAAVSAGVAAQGQALEGLSSRERSTLDALLRKLHDNFAEDEFDLRIRRQFQSRSPGPVNSLTGPAAFHRRLGRKCDCRQFTFPAR